MENGTTLYIKLILAYLNLLFTFIKILKQLWKDATICCCILLASFSTKRTLVLRLCLLIHIPWHWISKTNYLRNVNAVCIQKDPFIWLILEFQWFLCRALGPWSTENLTFQLPVIVGLGSWCCAKRCSIDYESELSMIFKVYIQQIRLQD